MEACKSQVQIVWDQHEKVSDQLKASQDELVKTKAALDKEERQFRIHWRGNNKLLPQMHTGSSKAWKRLLPWG